MKPVVAIVGRPNVGKSTLFNILAGSRIAIVEDTPGVTRDRIYADVTWQNYNFTLIDTGGIEPDSKDIILSQMRDQAQTAIDLADIILFITDVRQGLVDSDSKVADMLRRSKKKVILVVNKVDNFDKFMPDVYEFYNLGIGEPVPVSAASQLGIGDLLDEVCSNLPEENPEDEQDDRPKVAIIGKPNVGKSSIINKLVGANRVIVSDIAGTTRDAIDTEIIHDDREYVFIDTAGIRESSDTIERIGIQRSYASLDKAEIVIGLLDGKSPIEDLYKALPMVLVRVKTGQKLLLVRTKVDIYDAINPEEFPSTDRSYRVLPLKYPAFGTYNLSPGELVEKLSFHLGKKGITMPDDVEILDISAKTGEGMEALRRRLVDCCKDGLADSEGANMVTNLRHYEALRRAQDNLIQVSLGLERKAPIDLVAQDLRDAIYELGSIFGEVTTEDILDTIFSRFCIGK